MIKPTIGRVVWYHPTQADAVAMSDGDIHPALICKVWSDTCVNLAIFDSNGVPYNRTSVFLAQGDGPVPAYGYAEWMPYQIGQAAKTEGLAEQLAKGYTRVDPSDTADLTVTRTFSP